MSEGGEQETGYIKTTTHNYVSRQAKIEGAKQVEIKGRSILQDGVTVRGDLAIIRIGRYCEINSGTTLEPSISPMFNPTTMTDDNPNKYIPMVIGSHTHIGTNCKIQSAAIGSMVYIGNDVKIGKRCIIKDNCIIEEGVEIGDDTVIPPFTRITKLNPKSVYNELPPSIAVELQNKSLDRFQQFRQAQRVV